MIAIPPAKDSDAEDVAWGLQTAEALWKRGERADAIVWLRRAAQAAGEAADDDRALELARMAAELSDWMNTFPAVTNPPPAAPATSASPAKYDPHNASTFVPFGDDDRQPVAAGPAGPTFASNGPATYVPDGAPASQSVDVDVEDAEVAGGQLPKLTTPGPGRPAPPVGRPPSSPTMKTAEPYFPPVEPREPEQQPAPEDRDEHEPSATTSVPPAEQLHAGMFNPWDEAAASAKAPPIAPLAPPAPRFVEAEEEVITSVRPQPLAQQRADALAAAFAQVLPRETVEPPVPAAPPAPPPSTPARVESKAPPAKPAPPRPPPLPPRARKPPVPGSSPSLSPPVNAPRTPPQMTAPPEQRSEKDLAQQQKDEEHQRALALALGAPESAPALPAAQPTEPEPVAVEPSAPELARGTAEPAAPAAPAAVAPPEKLDLDSVDAFADLPDDARAAFAAAAEVSVLAEGEEVSGFALAYILSGTVDVAATMVDAPAARLASGAVLRSRGTTDEGVPMRLIGVAAGVVATWTDAEVQDAFRTCPWVEEDLRTAADRLQTLVGVTIGPLGERLDASIREEIIGKLTMRTLAAGEVVVTAGEQMPGLLLVGVGELELVDGERVAGNVGSGEFVFPTEVLGGGDAPYTARAGAGGALILFGDRRIAQELLVTCPPLLEVFAGM